MLELKWEPLCTAAFTFFDSSHSFVLRPAERKTFFTLREQNEILLERLVVSPTYSRLIFLF